MKFLTTVIEIILQITKNFSNSSSIARLLQFEFDLQLRLYDGGWWWCTIPDPFRGMGAQRSSTETQQSGYAPKVWTRLVMWLDCWVSMELFQATIFRKGKDKTNQPYSSQPVYLNLNDYGLGRC